MASSYTGYIRQQAQEVDKERTPLMQRRKSMPEAYRARRTACELVFVLRDEEMKERLINSLVYASFDRLSD